MNDEKIINNQISFYKSGGAGCLFAAHAAGDPEHYEWKFDVSEQDVKQVADAVYHAVAAPKVSTLSLLIPSITTVDDLVIFLQSLNDTDPFYLESEERFSESVCLGFRAKIGELVSWVTGFGNFSFLPLTRQAPCVELTIRTKPRPNYEWLFKPAPEGVIHLADMDMKGMSDQKLDVLWRGSLDNTEKKLNGKPDLMSAAKTTFALPMDHWPLPEKEDRDKI